MFVQGFGYGGSYRFAYGGFGSDGTINGILTQKVLDTQALRYTIDGDAAATAALNAAAQKISAHPDANRLRRDGLRWIPQVNGAFKVPVLSIHTLGTCMYRSPCSKAMPDVQQPTAAVPNWCSEPSAAQRTVTSQWPNRLNRSRRWLRGRRAGPSQLVTMC